MLFCRVLYPPTNTKQTNFSQFHLSIYCYVQHNLCHYPHPTLLQTLHNALVNPNKVLPVTTYIVLYERYALCEAWRKELSREPFFAPSFLLLVQKINKKYRFQPKCSSEGQAKC